MGEGGWRTNYKGCKHVPFVQCYLNPEDLGLKSVKNFKQYLKHKIRLFRVFPSVLYLTLYILLISKNPCIQFTGVESKGIQPSPPHLPLKCNHPRRRKGKYCCLKTVIFRISAVTVITKNTGITNWCFRIFYTNIYICNYLYFERTDLNFSEMRRIL